MTDKKPMPLAVADKLANALLERMSPYCEKIRVAGSQRRAKPVVGDIEIVTIPKIEKTAVDLFSQQFHERNLLLEYLDDLLEIGKIEKGSSWGQKARYFNMNTGSRVVSVNIFMTYEPEAWGNLLLLRTGCAEFSKAMFSRQEDGGVLPNHMRHVNGRLWDDSQLVPCLEEGDYFDAVGVDYIKPVDRNKQTARALSVAFSV